MLATRVPETPIERYWRRQREELPQLKKAFEDRMNEIEAELEISQAACNPHAQVAGSTLAEHCIKCGIGLGE